MITKNEKINSVVSEYETHLSVLFSVIEEGREDSTLNEFTKIILNQKQVLDYDF